MDKHAAAVFGKPDSGATISRRFTGMNDCFPFSPRPPPWRLRQTKTESSGNSSRQRLQGVAPLGAVSKATRRGSQPAEHTRRPACRIRRVAFQQNSAFGGGSVAGMSACLGSLAGESRPAGSLVANDARTVGIGHHGCGRVLLPRRESMAAAFAAPTLSPLGAEMLGSL